MDLLSAIRGKVRKVAGMGKFKRAAACLLAALSGAALGIVVRAVVLLAKETREAWWPAASLGALVGLAAALAWSLGGSVRERTRIAKVTVPLPGGGHVELAIDPDARQQLWRFFIEMASRIATQRLSPSEGLIGAALESLRSLFDRARADIGAMRPIASVPGGGLPPHIYVLEILNDDLRLCLARWHPRLDEWKRTGLPEARWPLASVCRDDLEATRQRVIERAWQLGTVLGIPDLARILPDRPNLLPNFRTEDEIEVAEALYAASDLLKPAWHIYVEAVSRVTTQPLASGAGSLGEAIASLYALFGVARAELKEMPPARVDDPPDNIQQITLALVNEDLRPFLTEWHPKHALFQKSGKPETEWPEAEACRTALEAARQRCVARIREVAQRLNTQAPAP